MAFKARETPALGTSKTHSQVFCVSTTKPANEPVDWGGAHRDVTVGREGETQSRRVTEFTHTATNSGKEREGHDPLCEYIVGPRRHAQS